MIIHEHRLDMIPNGQRTIVWVNQYDEDFTIQMELFAREGEFTVDTGTTAAIRGTKPDGNGYSADCTLTMVERDEGENSNTVPVVTITGDQQMTAAAGEGEFEITLYKNGEELSTANFTLNIERAALDKDTVASDSKIKEFVNVYDKADEIIAAGAQYESYENALTELTERSEAAAETAENASEEVETKRQQIVNLTVAANQTAGEAMNKASNAENGLADLNVDVARLIEIVNTLQNSSLTHIADWIVSNGVAYGINEEGDIVTSPLEGIGGGGGGGGGGGSSSSTMNISNTSGFNAKTIAAGDEAIVSFTWSSVESEMPTGNGTLKINVNGVIKATMDVPQGEVTLDIAPYLSAGSNNVRLTVTDMYDQSRFTAVNITVVSISISSGFDDSIAYEGIISFPYTPVGSVQKTVHFLLDGREIGTTVTSASGSQLSYTIPQQTHGPHAFECYFDCTINGQTVESNHIYYEITCIEPLNSTPIITSSFALERVPQYALVTIPYRVYTPNSSTSEVKLYVGSRLVSEQTVDRTGQSYGIQADTAGETTFRIVSGSQTKTITFTVTESDVQIQPVSEDLVLYLDAKGRSNNEATKAQWIYNDISATLSNFNWRQDGWLTDDDGVDILRLVGDARVTIPYKIFQNDFKIAGKTIEIEFATRQVSDYDAVIFSCYSGDIGLKVTPQNIIFKGAQNQINALYKDGEHLRLTITVDKQNENRLILIYIDGIASKAIPYAAGERFSQLSPVNITIGSNACGIDIYNIRVYDNNLNRRQVVDNWIADTQIGSLMIERYTRNHIYDTYGKIVAANLLPNLPYFILEAPELPQYKGDKKTISGSYTDPMDSKRSFTFDGCQINVQGTSSAVYYFKNFDLQFKSGFNTSSGNVANYGLRTNSIPFNRFVLKADVASSESANNTVLSMRYSDGSPYKTAEQIANPAVRQGIEGIPVVVFWYNPDTQETKFMGKYNFNLPKRAPEPLGYSGNMESWEFERNNSSNVKFQDDDFDTLSWDNVAQSYYPAWYDDWEARFPSDEWRDYTKLKEFISWVKSTDRAQATNEDLPEPVTYRLNSTITIDGYGSDNSYTVVDETSGGTNTGYKLITFTKDTPAYRLSKYRAELADRVEVDSATYYYLWTEYFLMIDSRAKNMFIGFKGSPVTIDGSAIDRKVVFEPYDMDTAIGTNNSGVLMFSPSLEDTDTVSSVISGAGGGSNAPVFNAQDSVMWVNFRDSFRAEITLMYRNLRASGVFDYNAFVELFENHQSKWSEVIYNEDAWNKYIVPLVDPVTVDESTGQMIRTDRYLTMLQGSKKWQRAWWLWNRQRYFDSKYVTGDAANNIISLRLFNSGTLTLTPAVDMYVGVSFGGGTTPSLDRTEANTPVSFQYVAPSGVTEMETWIYSADLITNVGDLSVFYPNEVDFGKATRLKRLKIGSNASGYSNANLRALDVRNSELLEYIDCRNCPNLAITVNLEGSPRLEEAYFDGTAITGVDLADGGVLETLHLPATITTLTLLNLSNLSDLTVASYSNVSRLMIANMSEDVVDIATILGSIQPNSQVYIEGLAMEASTAQEIEDFLDLLDTMSGVTREKSASGEWLYHDYDTAQVFGTIHINALTGAQVASYNARYPYIRIQADHVTSYLTYKSYDGSTTLKTVTCLDGVPQEAAPSGPSRTSTAQYSYTFVGWNSTQDQQTAEVGSAGPTSGVIADTTLYAAYTATVRTYTVTWKNSNGTTLETDTNVPYGSTPHYDGSTPQNPTSGGGAFQNWTPAISSVTGDVTYTASYIVTYTVYFYNGSTLLQTVTGVQKGGSATYTGATPQRTDVENAEDYTFTGWSPAPTNVQANTSCYAQYSFSGVVNSISDTLETVISKINSGTFDYEIGDTKKFSMGSMGNMSMQLVAKNADALADNSGNAKTTWMLYYILPTDHSMNPSKQDGVEGTGSLGGWDKSEMKQYVLNTVVPNLPQVIRDNVKTVKKYTRIYDTSGSAVNDVQTDETFWLASRREMFGAINNAETQGPIYSTAFPDNASRVKKKVGASSAGWWWLRSAYSSYNFSYVYSDGSYDDIYASYSSGVVLGFCI